MVPSIFHQWVQLVLSAIVRGLARIQVHHAAELVVELVEDLVHLRCDGLLVAFRLRSLGRGS